MGCRVWVLPLTQARLISSNCKTTLATIIVTEVRKIEVKIWKHTSHWYQVLFNILSNVINLQVQYTRKFDNLSFAVIRGLNVSTSQFSKPTTPRENEYLHDDVADYSKLNQSVDDPNCLALNMNHFARVILKQRGRHCLAKTACHLASTGRRTVIVLAWLQS